VSDNLFLRVFILFIITLFIINQVLWHFAKN